MRRFAGGPRQQGKSLNEVAVEPLARGSGAHRTKQRDLSSIIGKWHNDPAFDRAIAAQDTVDPEMWK